MSVSAPAASASADAYNTLVEETVLLIRQSAAVQEARLDVLLDAAVLAAEQVQDVRLLALEAPANIEGWDLWMPIAAEFFLGSNLPGKLLTRFAQKSLGLAVKTNTLFFALPKSQAGKDLEYFAKNIFRDPRRVVKVGLPALKLPGLSDKEALSLYHESIQLFVTTGSKDATDFLNGAAKAARFGHKAATSGTDDPLPVEDSAGVTVLSAAQDYARASRLGIQFRHAALEAYVRRGAQPAALATVIATVGTDGLDELEQRGAQVSLATVRNKFRLILEALIWARLYDFREAPPSKSSNPGILATKDELEGPPPRIQEYWRARFQAAADQHARSRGGTIVTGDKTQSLRLRRYFAAINYEISQQRSGQADLMTSLSSLP